jgi:hypothetical protein
LSGALAKQVPARSLVVAIVTPAAVVRPVVGRVLPVAGGT